MEKGLRHMVIQIQFRYSQHRRLQQKGALDWPGELAASSDLSLSMHKSKASELTCICSLIYIKKIHKI